MNNSKNILDICESPYRKVDGLCIYVSPSNQKHNYVEARNHFNTLCEVNGFLCCFAQEVQSCGIEIKTEHIQCLGVFSAKMLDPPYFPGAGQKHGLNSKDS